MSEALNRQAIYNIIKAIAGIGKVYDYERYANNDSDFIKLFKDASSGRILGGEISRSSCAAEKISSIEEESGHGFIIRYYMGVEDAAKTEIFFNAKIEQIRAAFRGNNTLSGNCLDISALTATVIEVRSFGGVLCHYAELRMTVAELLT